LLAEPALRAQLGHAAQAFHREHLEIGKFYARLLDIWRSGGESRVPSKLLIGPICRVNPMAIIWYINRLRSMGPGATSGRA
jgi:hypothetical protein